MWNYKVNMAQSHMCTLEAGTQQISHDKVGNLHLSLTCIHFQLFLIREMISLSQHWRWNILSLKYLDHVFPFQKKTPCCKSTCSRGRCLSILAGSKDKTFLFFKGKLNPASMSGPSLYSYFLRCSGNEKPCSYLLRSSQHSPTISIFQKSYMYTSSWRADVLSSRSWKANYTYLPNVLPQNGVTWNKLFYLYIILGLSTLTIVSQVSLLSLSYITEMSATLWVGWRN